VGPVAVVLAMRGDAFDAGPFEAVASGFADGGAAAFVFVVGGDVADAFM